MSLASKYTREERPRLEPGSYRVAITDAREAVSQSKNNMIVVTVAPNGFEHVKIHHHIVDGPYFNRNMTSLFDSFNIEDGDFRYVSWIGATGAAVLKQDGDYLKVHYFIPKDRQDDLPDWIGTQPECVTIDDSFTVAEDEELPF